jgi:hypothetical protein
VEVVPDPPSIPEVPARSTFDPVALVRFKREHGRWPSVDEAIAVTGSSLVIGRTGLEGSIVLPEDPQRAWHEWADAENGRRHADAEAEAERRHAEVLARIEAQRWTPEQAEAFISEMRQLAKALGLVPEERRA